MQKHALIRNTVLLFLAFAGMGLGSCKKEITQTVNQGFSAIYNVHVSGWQGDGSGAYYSYTLDVPELDDVILAHGGVSVYLSFDNGATYEATPEVVGNVAYGSYHSLHTVGIDLSPADGTGIVSPPTKELLAKVVLLDAQPLD